MIGRIINRLEQTPMTFSGWCAAFLGIAIIRTFLENASGRSAQDIATTDVQTLVHYVLFYIPAILVIVLTVWFFTKRDILLVSRVALFGFLVVLIPPVLDLIISGGAGYRIAYLLVFPAGLFSNFITLFGDHVLPGITPGIRIEICLIVAATFLYIYTRRKSIVYALLGSTTVYSLIFVLLALPSVLNMADQYVWLLSIKNSLIGHQYFHPSVAFVSESRTFEMYFNVVISQVLYVWGVVCFAAFAYIWNPKKIKAIFKNSRPERVFHYLLMLTLGIGIAASLGFIALPFSVWNDYLTLGLLALSFYFAWMFAVGCNDIADLTSDTISNSTRPLVTGILTVTDVRQANAVFLGLAVLGGYLTGHYALFMVLVFTAVYYVYSVPPLQLKRFVGINAFLISLATLSAVLAGYYTVSVDPRVGSFPKEWGLLIILAYTLIANVKDIKDSEGDSAVGVYTIPVLLGPRRGKQVIAVLAIVMLASVPVILGAPTLWLPFVPFAIATYYVMNKEIFVERHLFYMYFLYIFVCAALF